MFIYQNRKNIQYFKDKLSVDYLNIKHVLLIYLLALSKKYEYSKNDDIGNIYKIRPDFMIYIYIYTTIFCFNIMISIILKIFNYSINFFNYLIFLHIRFKFVVNLSDPITFRYVYVYPF